MQSILSDQKDLERTATTEVILTKTDRVLSGDPVVVEIKHEGPYQPPSYTDGKTITFNADKIGDVTDIEDLVSMLGLNYHELAHVLYTPRANSDLVKRVMDNYLHPAFNILEDQRIETFLTATYPSTIPYLTTTFMRYCTENDRSWQLNYTLVYGRRYIPVDIRREFKRRFVMPHLIDEIEAIIDQYRKLVFPAQDDIAFDLIARFGEILNEIGQSIEDPHGHSTNSRPDIRKGRPSTQREQTKASQAADELDEAIAKEEKEEEASSQGSGDSDDRDGDEDGEGQGSGSGERESDEASDSSDSDGASSGEESQGEESSGDGNGASIGNGKASDDAKSDDDLRKAMQDIIDSAMSDRDVVEDVSLKQRAIVQGDGSINTNLGVKRRQEMPLNITDIEAARHFASVIDRLRADVDPGWLRYAPSGRVNLQRVMRGDSYDRVWDKWQEGNDDASDIECVILIDTSISMKYQMVQASKAMWVIKKALETINASVSVFAYNDETYMVYEKNERANPTAFKNMKAENGTQPHEAITQAVRILDASRRKNKVFIAITDGDWPYEYSNGVRLTSDEMIAELNKRGVMTAIAFIGMVGSDTHNCQIHSTVSKSNQLVDFARKIVEESMKRRPW